MNTGNLQHVIGYCPMGCGATLAYAPLTQGVQCTHPECPRPGAAGMVLRTNEVEHIVYVREDHFTVEHPLKDRVVFARLDDCGLYRYMKTLDSPPKPVGVYRVTEEDGCWEFERIGDLDE